MSRWEPPEGRCRCGRTIEILERWCRSCAAKHADRLVAGFVKRRDGRCVVDGCRRPGMEAAHVLAKGAHPKIRWDATNVLTLCHEHHRFFTNDPRSWHQFIDDYAPGLWDELLEYDRSGPRVDLAEVITRFKAVAA